MENKIKNLDNLKEFIQLNSKFKFKIKVVANSKNNSIEFLDDFVKIKIKEKAQEGKANKAIVDFLAAELKFPKSKINILNGHKSAIKTIELG